MSKNWIFLLAAIFSEVLGTTSMKLSTGFTKLLPSAMMFAFYAASLGFLTLAIKRIEIGVAYAIWSGLGTTLIVLIGIFVFRESISALKMLSILLVISGVIGLNLSTHGH